MIFNLQNKSHKNVRRDSHILRYEEQPTAIDGSVQCVCVRVCVHVHDQTEKREMRNYDQKKNRKTEKKTETKI